MLFTIYVWKVQPELSYRASYSFYSAKEDILDTLPKPVRDRIQKAAKMIKLHAVITIIGFSIN